MHQAQNNWSYSLYSDRPRWNKIRNQHHGKPQDHSNSCRLNTHFLIITGSSKKIRIQIPWFKWEWGHKLQKPMGHSKRSLKKEVYSHSIHIRKLERFQINNLMIYLKLLEEQRQANLKRNRWNHIIKIRVAVNGYETKKPKETKSWFFSKINKINKLLHKLTKRGKEKTWIN